MKRHHLSRTWLTITLTLAVLVAAAYAPLSRILAAPSATILTSAGKPLVNLRAPLTLKPNYAGSADAVSELRSGSAKPVSLLVSDLDLDGAADLVAGYAMAHGGVVTVSRGNPDAYAPKDRSLFKAAVQGKVPPTFLRDVAAFAVPESPDLLAAGDFSGHGHRDLLVARNGGGLYLLEGDGHGRLGEAKPIPLPGNVTALAANNRGQVAVGVAGATTPQLLLFDARAKGFSEAASTHPLNDAATSLAWGDLGSRTGSDLAAATGTELFLVYRALSPHAQTDTVALGYRAESLVLGDYIWDRAGRTEIAALAEDGTIHILQHGTLDVRPLTEADIPARRAMRSMAEIARRSQPQSAARLGAWHEASKLGFAASSTNGIAAQSRLQSPRLAATSTHDLMLLDSGLRQLNLLDTSGKASFRSAISFASAPVAAAALPAKLNGDRDFVVLTSGQTAPIVFTSASTQLVTVTTVTDEDDASACTNSAVTLGTTGADGVLSLREATCEANNSTGTIDILLPSGIYKIGLRAGGETGELQFGTASGSNIFLIGTGTQNDTAIEQINGIDRVINIDPNMVGNITATILNVTIKDGTETDGQGGAGILAGAAGDVVTLSDDTVSFNTTQTGDAGGGIAMANGGTLIANAVSFTGNAATLAAGGGLYFVEGSGGDLQIISSYVTSNTASSSGGGIFADLVGGAGTVSGTQFTGNQATDPSGVGGGVYAEDGTLTVGNSRIVGNTAAAGGTGVYAANSGVAIAVDNWWGCNAGPGNSGCDNTGNDGSSSVNSDPWLVLSLGAASPGILPGATDLLDASVGSDSNGGSGFSIPNGTQIDFTGTLGTINPSTAYTSLGDAQTVFTAGPSGGTAVITATLDSQTVSLNITIGLAPAITSGNSATFITGTPGSFTVTATGTPTPAITESGSLPSGVTFVDSGTGSATLSGTPASGSGGIYTLTITAANGVTPNATQTFTLTVNGAPAFTSANAATFPVGTSSSFTVTTSGFPAPTISETGALPSGVSFVNNGNGTGTLSGTPAAGSAGTYSLSFTAANGIGSNATQSFTLTVSQAPAITSANNATFQVGTSASFTVTVTGSPTPSISESGALPSGVTLVDNHNGTATLSGTPAAGTGASYPITITAQNGISPNATQSLTLTVNQAPAITSNNTASFQVNTSGSFTVTTSGFPAPGLTETGALPSGVAFVDNHNGTGTLSGTPTASGTFTITFTATNSVSVATQSFTLTVTQVPAFTGASSTTFQAGTSGSFTVTTSGFPAPALTESGALPGGVTFVDNKNGTATLSGSATSGGVFSLTLTATNSAGTATQSFTLTVNQAPAFTSANNTAFQTGSSGSFTVTTAGFPAASLSESGTLPSGVSFVDNHNGTGTLSGTASAAGTFSITFTATNSVSTVTQNFTLSVNQGPAITSAASATFVVGSSGSFTVTTTGTPAPSLTEKGALPAGVAFVDNKNGTGTLSGTPAAGAIGTFSISFTASNTAGSSTQDFTLTVNQAPAITSANSVSFQLGVAGTFTVTATGFPTPSLTASGTLPAGTVFADNGNGTASLSGTASQAGSFPITLNATSTAGTATQSFTLTVATAGTVTTIASSANPSTAGQSITLTASVVATVAGKPTGTVTFLDGSTSLGTSALSTGAATLSTSSLVAGTHSLTASYSGDTNFAGSTSVALSQVVNAAGAPDFTLSASPSTASVAAGSTASYTITAAALNGFTSAVSLACSGLPSEATCTFTPASVTPGSSPATSTLAIKTTAPTTAALTQPASGRRSGGLYAIWLLLPAMMFGTVGLASEKHRKRLGYLLALLVVGACMLQAGCGSSSSSSGGGGTTTGGTPAGTYTVTVTGTSGSTSHTTSVTLTVQ